MKLSKKQKASIKAILGLRERLEAMVVEMLRRDAGGTLEGRTNRSGIEEGVRGYQRYLVLRLLHPERMMRPMPGTDDLWHAHILDTRAYHADCEKIFGEYLHHDPGVRDASQDAAMRELHHVTFVRDKKRKHDPVLEPLMLAAVAAASSVSGDGEDCA